MILLEMAFIHGNNLLFKSVIIKKQFFCCKYEQSSAKSPVAP